MKTKETTVECAPFLDSQPAEKAPNTHRNDLQLIRGVAIFSVVLFHFFPMLTPNGYLGVDQFFVLSGFLMSSIFGSKPITWPSTANFYYRRIKRIMPLYLLTILIDSVIVYLGMSNKTYAAHVNSAKNALFLMKNSVLISDESNYALLLMSASDHLTHTWSLCVEMQFYLIAPILFAISNCFKSKFGDIGRLIFLVMIGIVSFFGQLHSPESIAFNGTHCRLWQFTTGIISFHMHEIFPICNGIQGRTKVLSVWVLVGCITATFVPFHVPSTISRPIVTVLTGCLILIGSMDPAKALSNRTFEYLGDVSFSWYLVHWPVYCITFMCYYYSYYALFCGVIISYMLSVILHKTFEKFYLSLEKIAIVVLLVILYASVAAVIILLSQKSQESKREWSVKVDPQHFNVSNNWTLEEAMELNERFDSSSFGIMGLPNCQPPGNLCKFENEDYGTVANYTTLLMGNSYACNAAAIINKHFSKLSKEMYKLCRGGCEVLSGVKWWFPHCHKEFEEYIDTVKTIKPDVLFILVRHLITIDRAPIFGNISNDGVVLKAVKRLQEFEDIVSTKIYLLDSMPHVSIGYVKKLNRYLKEGRPIKTSDFLDPTISHRNGQRRMKEIARRCQKCELFTYLDELNDKNGEMELIRDDNKLAFWSNFAHLTPAGIDRISPIYERLAEKLANETKIL